MGMTHIGFDEAELIDAYLIIRDLASRVLVSEASVHCVSHGLLK